ncbi:Uncharacterised protein [Propionibacterium australiense]|nr:Uncharacterised protein [Propionibacterium australiense]
MCGGSCRGWCHRREHFLVAASELGVDVFLMGRPGTSVEGTVSWCAAGEVIDRYDDFRDFYLAMLEYNERNVRRFRERNGLPAKSPAR